MLRGGSGRTQSGLETSASPNGGVGLISPNDLYGPMILREYLHSLVLKIAQ